jgi:hypothetical protein
MQQENSSMQTKQQIQGFLRAAVDKECTAIKHGVNNWDIGKIDLFLEYRIRERQSDLVDLDPTSINATITLPQSRQLDFPTNRVCQKLSFKKKEGR